MPRKKKQKNQLLETCVGVTNILANLVVICTVLGFLENSFYVADLLANFRFQYSWILVLVALLNFVMKERKTAALFLVFSLINIYVIKPTWGEGREILPKASLFYANVLSSNDNHGRLMRTIRLEKPDFIALVEVNKKWQNSLTVLNEAYPHQIWVPREDNFGIAFLSKSPIEKQDVFLGAAGVESIYAQVKQDDQELNIVVTHPLPPSSSENWRMRNRQFQELGSYLKKLSGNIILIGDFNTTPWSSQFKSLITRTQLIPQYTFKDTWPAFFPVGFRIKIDHVFTSNNLHGTTYVLGDIHSDHLPLIYRFSF